MVLTGQINGNMPIVFLMGPTASGKTDVAAKLSEHLPFELISVDAAQVYCGMNIGTAKPDQQFLDKYPHHLIDIRQPADTYSAANFVEDAHQLIEKIHSKGRIPLFVGGTMFYFNALENGLSPLPPSNSEIRGRLDNELIALGLPALYQRLQKIDPLTAKSIEPGDQQRIQRALEIYLLTGKQPSTLKQGGKGLAYPIFKFTLHCPNRLVLHQRIHNRFLQMMDQGLVEEVKSIASSLQNPETTPCMRIVGYRQIYEGMTQGLSEQLI